MAIYRRSRHCCPERAAPSDLQVAEPCLPTPCSVHPAADGDAPRIASRATISMFKDYKDLYV